jgi:two-component system OmpR family response regulator
VCDVLVLDDEPLIRELLVEVLANEGFSVREAETVREAQAVLREHGARLLVADKNLHEGEDGHALAHEAMRLCPGLLVVYISGRWEALRDLALDLTPRERILPKPFTASRLVALAHELLGNQNPSLPLLCDGRQPPTRGYEGSAHRERSSRPGVACRDAERCRAARR